mmetsp:Transcript_22993/g.20429  ORF Transcript_22993/g.20429 Transcript_22993/m.20429 type:complete len:100 (+) Transcript_22993:81-380(+)
MIYVNRGPFPTFPEDNPIGLRSPQDIGLEYEDITISTEDNCILKGWLINQQNPKSHPTIVFLHENAGNIGLRMDFIQYLFNSINSNILIVGYRGYGHST